MTKEEQVTSGDSDLETANTPVENSPNPEGKDDKVAYESYKKLLSEKKKLQGELEKLAKEKQLQTEGELQAQEKYKELWETTKLEVDNLRQKNLTYEERWNDAIKLDAFNRSLSENEKIDSKYYSFIDTNKILIDPETSKVDLFSAQKEVERIKSMYPEIVRSKVSAFMPNNQPSSSGTLTREQWLQLPPKEMAKRMKEVKGN